MNDLCRIVLHRSVLLAALVTWPSLADPAAPAALDDPLVLRLNDAEGEPGSRVAVVVRTYAPRGVEQGQICLRASTRLKVAAEPVPFAVLEEVVVFSDAGDALTLSTFDKPGQTALLEFSSASGSVNRSDGPLAVLYFRLDGLLTGGEEFLLELDTAASFLVGAGGASIPIEARNGVVSIRPPGAPRRFEADGDSVLPGEAALLEAETLEPFAVSAGQVAFLYDAALAGGDPTVTMNPRHGSAVWSADTSIPGRVVVAFESVDSSLNTVPGGIVSLSLPTSATAARGSRSAVEFDPVLTWLEDPDGQKIELALSGGVLELGGGGMIFADGFESGDLSTWSVAN